MLNWLKKHESFTVGLVFASIAAWFSWLNWYPGFRDGDGFYHAKMVELMRDHGLVRDFHWLPLTVLAEHFADHHLLYHIIIVPVATVVSPLAAVKIVSVLLGFLVCVLLYRILRVLKTPRPEFLIVLLAITPYFALRATMAKASGIAMLIQFGILAAILAKNRLWMFVLALVYVWSHAGFPFAVMMVLVMMTAKIFVRSAESGSMKKSIREVWREEWPSLTAVTLGIIAGILTNPYFPENLLFYWYQIVQIAIVGTPKELTVGLEWYPIDPKELFALVWPFAVAIGIPITALVLTKRVPVWERAKGERFMLLFGLTALTFMMSLRSNRHAEYFFPYITLFVGEVFAITLPLIDWQLARTRALELIKTKWQRRGLTLAAFLIALSPIHQMTATAHLIRDGVLPWDGAKKTAEFVRSATAPGEIVFDGSWDYFPQLWYWNDENRYISGLDPRFLAAKNADLALKYQDLDVKKESTKDLFSAFPSRIIVMIKQKYRKEALDALEADTMHFKKRYEDQSSAVFEMVK
jgi:hypothetical protein